MSALPSDASAGEVTWSLNRRFGVALDEGGALDRASLEAALSNPSSGIYIAADTVRQRVLALLPTPEWMAHFIDSQRQQPTRWAINQQRAGTLGGSPSF